MLSKLLDAYHNFILNNLETVDLIETSLRALLFLVPGRFRDSEVKLELAYASTGIVTLYHDLIVLKYLHSILKPPEEEDGNVNTKSILPPQWCTKIAKYISLIQHTELIIEIYAKQKWGKRGKWTAIAVIEIVKAILKLILLFKTNGNKLLIHNFTTGIPHYDSNSVKQILNSHIASKKEEVKKERRRVISKDKWEKFKNQASKNQTTVSLPPQARDTKLKAEFLNIIRPLVYLASIFSFGKKSWKAWITSFIVDISSLVLAVNIARFTNELEKDEILRRLQLMLLYALRSPMYQFLFRNNRFFTNFASMLKRLPFGTTISDLVCEYIAAYRTRYFYISGT